MKALITGGTGFIATYIADKLMDKGIDVLGYDLDLGGDIDERKPNPMIIEGDILSNEFLTHVMLDYQPDYVIHCACIAGIDTVGKMPVDTLQVAVIGTWNVLEAARKVPNLKRFVNFSTSEIYGSEAFRVAEDSPASIGPVGYSRWVYAAGKLAGEHMTKAFHTQYLMPTVTVRPFNVYGPGQIGDSAMKTFIENAIAGKSLVVKGGGDQVRCWCYIDDFVDGIMPLLFDDRAIGETFNIGNEQAGEEIGALAHMIVELTGSKSKIEYDYHGPADIRYRVPCLMKMEKMFGYAPSVSLEEGIKRTEEWIRHADTV